MINPIYSPAPERYDNGMKFRRCGQSGILLPEISLGLWHNFGDMNTFANSQAMAHYAFDRGITHFDLANNYGPSYGSAEETFGMIMKKSFMPYRDELFISTKAGHDMWPGPYGEWGSRKYLMSSLNQSLKRMNLEYVDIFYSHRYDPDTPLEETLQALVDIVRQGKALYVGISKYPKEAAEFAYKYLEERDVHCLLYQGRYNQHLLMQKELELYRQKQEFKKESELKDQKIDSLKEENLQAELSHKSEELIRTTWNIVRKNEMLMGIKKEVLGISHSISEENLVSLRRKTLRLLGQIETNIEHDDDLQAFQSTFDSVYHDFFRKLEEAYPELNNKDKLLCAYIKMNLLSKEIAPLLNISLRGVEISRYRLRKKLGLEEGENLAEFLQRFNK